MFVSQGKKEQSLVTCAKSVHHVLVHTALDYYDSRLTVINHVSNDGQEVARFYSSFHMTNL